ncbi:MAG TPA: ATP-binding protein, partial [Polyangiaceae bacterium]|nr:ATP-binding protein [Polyangiaceae bacterium]
AISQLISAHAQLADFVMVYLLGVMALAMRSGLGPSLFAACVSILSFDYFFIPPKREWAWPDSASVLTFVGMLIMAGVISGLNREMRREREAAQRNEAFAKALYRFSSELAEVSSLQQLGTFAGRRLGELLDADILVAFCTSDGEIDVASLAVSSDKERGLALAAWSTSERVESPSLRGYNVWCPLLGSHRSVGVLGLSPRRRTSPLVNTEQRELLEACARLLAGAVERMLLAAAARRAELQAETEHTRSSLLAAVSHDLRTPLASILTAATTVARQGSQLAPAARDELMNTIVDETERLNHLVANLLSMTKLESGELLLKRQPEELSELVGSALSALASRGGTERVRVNIPADLPLLDVDSLLIEQTLINLLENALRYAPGDSPIDVDARRIDDSVQLRVCDRGPGILSHEREKVFEKFFRGSGTRHGDGGAGLGLTICRAAARAHQGKLRALERSGGGTCMELTLPRAAAPTEAFEE